MPVLLQLTADRGGATFPHARCTSQPNQNARMTRAYSAKGAGLSSTIRQWSTRQRGPRVEIARARPALQVSVAPSR
jgi:hypothetical protein